MLEPRYSLLKTLTRGKQQPKENVQADGTVKVTYYGAVFCYILLDKKDNKKYAMTPFEVADVVSDQGADNIKISLKALKDGSFTTTVNGIGFSVQSAEYVVTDYREYLEQNKDIVLTDDVKKALERKPRARGTGGRKAAEPKYTAEQIREAIRAAKEAKAKTAAPAPAGAEKKAPAKKSSK